MTDGPAITTQRIRFALSQLRAQNGHHKFEELCWHFARLHITPNVLFATGPVAKGGDQGRDFETFHSYIRQRLPNGFLALHDGERMVFACTLQHDRLKDKIKSDVRKIMAGARVDRIYVFCEADVTVAERHDLTRWLAEQGYAVELEVFDGTNLAKLLTDPKARWIAEHHLDVAAPDEQPDSPEYNDFIGHGVQAASVRGDITINHHERPGISGRRFLLLVGLTATVAALVTVMVSAGKIPGTGSTTSPNPIRPSVVESSTPPPLHHVPTTLLSGLAGKTWQGRVYADPAIAHGSNSVSSAVTVSIDPSPEGRTGGTAGKILFGPDCGGRLTVVTNSAHRLVVVQKMSRDRPRECTMTDATVTMTAHGSELRLSAATPQLGHVYTGNLPRLPGQG